MRLAAFCLVALAASLFPAAGSADTRPGPQLETTVPAEHADWTRLLKTHVKMGSDGITRFDYAGLAASQTGRAALDAYIARFADIDLSAKTDANFAAWANLYNAVTVRHIVERYPVKSIRDGSLAGPWKVVKVKADGREVSLDDIEHKILRKTWGTPDVHYALNCASYSCPNLPPKAWEAATLEADLAAAARAYVNQARGVSVTARGLAVSSIYDWFEADFGGSKAAVIEHLLKYAEPGLAEKIRANPKIVRYRYDWSLNDAAKLKKKR
ncbi:DUF547 domain-containing protein [Hyphomonas sp.]|uniref:DUF547 domain-containing protein n=1 Tax=Hyphomonas sp. TaxID=87 RepID=UPI0039192065